MLHWSIIFISFIWFAATTTFSAGKDVAAYKTQCTAFRGSLVCARPQLVRVHNFLQDVRAVEASKLCSLAVSSSAAISICIQFIVRCCLEQPLQTMIDNSRSHVGYLQLSGRIPVSVCPDPSWHKILTAFFGCTKHHRVFSCDKWLKLFKRVKFHPY